MKLFNAPRFCLLIWLSIQHLVTVSGHKTSRVKQNRITAILRICYQFSLIRRSICLQVLLALFFFRKINTIITTTTPAIPTPTKTGVMSTPPVGVV
ncbi:MAG: hypothetical protein ACXABY_29045, partial [Candidatus Thorarchaeota archaeon]